MKRAALLLLSAAACAEGGDQYLIVIDSDMIVPTELAAIEVDTWAEGGHEGDGASFDPTRGGLPLSFGVEPPDGGRLIVEVRAIDGQGGEVLNRLAVVETTVGAITRVPIFLARDCRGVQCSDHQACTEEGCSEQVIGPDVLRDVEEGREDQDLCQPNEGRCLNDGASVERCRRYGAPVETIDCNPGDHCDTERLECVPSTGADMVRVEVIKAGSGAGYVRSFDNQIDCGPKCFLDVPRGTSLMLEAMPDTSSSFVTWEGSCGGGGGCTIVANASTTVTARFDSFTGGGQQELVVDVFGGGTGRITSTPPGIDCTSGMCRAYFPSGTDVTLNASPQGMSGFAGWTGDCSGLATCTVRMDGPRWTSANFVYDDGSINVKLDVVFGGDGIGYVSSFPAGIDCGGLCSANFARGTRVQLVATPEPDNQFLQWDGACSGSGDCFVDMGTNLEVFAVFASNTPRFVPMDVNGDGFPDLVAGAPGMDVGGQADAGRVYIAFGGQTSPTMMAASAHRVFDGPSANARLGASVAVGDLDGDGFDDIAMGAPNYQGRGAVFIVFGGPGLIGSGNVGGGGGPMIVGEAAGDGFGTSLWIDDLDGDGYGDLLVGAPSDGPAGVGHAYLFQGVPGFAPTVTNYFARFESGAAGDAFGASVAIVGDVNQDTWWDIAIGAPKWSTDSRGRVSLFFGRATATPNSVVSTADVRIDGRFAMDSLGWSLTPVGDFNVDGIDDIAIGSPINDRVHVHYGRTAWLPNPADGDLVLSGLGWFGAAVGGGHDVTGDGIPDLVVGAPLWEGNKGAVEIFSGSTNPSATSWRRIEGRCVDDAQCGHEFFGFTVDVRTDLDNNGMADLFVGSRFGGGVAGMNERGRVSSFDLPSYTNSGPLRSADAQVHFVGEDQTEAWCAAVPGSRAFD